MKKTLCLLLSLLLLCGALAACTGGSGDPAGTGAGTGSGEPADETGTDGAGIPLSLKYDGRTFRILTSPFTGDAYTEIYLDYEDTNEVIGASVQKRNDMVMERLGVELEIYHSNNYWNAVSGIVELNMSDYPYYDAAYVSGLHAYPEAMTGQFIDLNVLDYVDFDASYWDRNCYETLSLGGKNYVMVSDMSMSVLQNAHCTFFNKQMLADNNIDDDIYQMVREGTWTFDKMLQMAKKANRDNGDDVRNEQDTYGFFNMNIVTLLSSLGYQLTPKGEDDYPTLFSLTSEMHSDFETLRDIIFDPSLTFICETMLSFTDYGDFGHMWDWTRGNMFTNDQIMFMYCGMSGTNLMRDMKSDYGIIPNAKRTEKQADYECTADNYSDFLCVPMTVTDNDFTGAVLEYMAYASTDTVRRTYIDEVMKIKRSRDPENESEMIDTIIDSIYYELSDFAGLTIRDILSNSLQKGNLQQQYDKFAMLYSNRIDAMKEQLMKSAT